MPLWKWYESASRGTCHPGRDHPGMVGDIISERWAELSRNRWATSFRNHGRLAPESATDTEAKALAMSWVSHLTGDLHQPLHVTDRGDRGGNQFNVTYHGRTSCRVSNSSGTQAKVELHSVWDGCLVFTLENGRTF